MRGSFERTCWRKVRRQLGLMGLVALTVVGCRNEETADPPLRPVSVVTVASSKHPNAIAFSGAIQAKKDVGLAFRIGGRVVDRLVNVGDRVTAGQLIARLDPTLEENALTAAKAALDAARGEVVRARSAFARQDRLMSEGFTTRSRFDEALRSQEVAEAQLEAAEAQADTARLRLGYTRLYADAAGTVTARSIEAGEVVQPGQVIVQIARDDGRDAVFAIPARWLETQAADATVRVALADAPAVTATGRIREVSPIADQVTRTFEVRIGLQNPPDAMRLGSTVVGELELATPAVVEIPASALTQQGTSPAVWVVDPKTTTVSLRTVDVLRFDPGKVIVSQGLEPGDLVVSQGIQALHPGQRVKVLSKSAASVLDKPWRKHARLMTGYAVATSVS